MKLASMTFTDQLEWILPMPHLACHVTAMLSAPLGLRVSK